MPEVIKTSIIEMIVYPVALAEIHTLGDRVKALTINGPSDTEGALAVKEARKECRSFRTRIEAKRVELKAESLAYGRKVDEVAKTLQAALEPFEQHLIGQEKAVEAELERIARAKEDALYEVRLKQWVEAGGGKTDRAYLLQFGQARFEEIIADVAEQTRQRKEAEAKAIEDAERNRIEAARIKAEREQLEADQRAAKAEQDRLLAESRAKAATLKARQRAFAAVQVFPEDDYLESLTDDVFQHNLRAATEVFDREQQLAKDRQKKLDDQQAAIDAETRRQHEAEETKARVEQLARDMKEAAEKARIETEQRIAREAEIAEQTRLAEVARQAKEESLRPTREKLNVFASALLSLQRPQLDVATERRVLSIVNNAAQAIRKIAAELGE